MNGTGYIAHVTNELVTLLNGIVTERSLNLFRREPQVVLSQGMRSHHDFELRFITRDIGDAENGSFSVHGSDRVLTFRNPQRITLHYGLCAPEMDTQALFRVCDRLYSHFFDCKTVEAFLPASLEKYPALFEKLKAARAELKVKPRSAVPSPNTFLFEFEYSALYHSGNPLREELKVTSRVIEYQNHSKERSMP